MVLRNFRRSSAFVAALALGNLLAASVDAQVIVGRGAGISINVPGVGGVRLGAPGVYGRPYGLSRRSIISGYGVAPNSGVPYGSGYPSRFVGRPGAPPTAPILPGDPSLTLPTAGQLRAMADSELLNAIVGLTQQLDADLSRFDTGDTWQRYLRLPDDAMPPPSDGRVNLSVGSLTATLARFDRTVANAKFVQISGLPSFAASHAALAEVVRRFDAQSAVFDAPSTASNETNVTEARRVPPAIPVPPDASLDDDLKPRGIGMRNLYATEDGVRNDAEAASPRIAQPRPYAEELPSPSGSSSLAAPQNDGETERSILAK